MEGRLRHFAPNAWQARALAKRPPHGAEGRGDNHSRTGFTRRPAPGAGGGPIKTLCLPKLHAVTGTRSSRRNFDSSDFMMPSKYVE